MELAQKLAIILDKITVAAEDIGVAYEIIPAGSPGQRLVKLNLVRLQDAVNDLDVCLSEMGAFPPA